MRQPNICHAAGLAAGHPEAWGGPRSGVRVALGMPGQIQNLWKRDSGLPCTAALGAGTQVHPADVASRSGREVLKLGDDGYAAHTTEEGRRPKNPVDSHSPSTEL